MLFPTVEFAIFFFFVFSISWALSSRHELRKIFLAASSYFFYGYWDPRFCLLLGLTSVVNYAVGRILVQKVESLVLFWDFL